ncbi:hypothetical protein SK128_013120 [Halocaridina rubra]|uniref:Uncharacterized protein n=1 Tax=Halocaridina rubra TaxID=373956 RepID=A0AAN9A508_HALRR
MPLPPQCRYKTCLGCIPLQQGCIILGCTGMVGSLLELIARLRALVDFELSVNQCRQREYYRTGDEQEGNNDPLRTTNETENDEDYTKKCPSDNIVNFARFVFGFSSFSYFVYFVTAAMMIYGVKKKIPRLMAPWMGWEVAQIFFNILVLLGLGGYGSAPYSISSLLEIILMIYFILVVTSYYLELKEGQERHSGITVMAVSQTPHEMTVVIPSTHPKDDPPPPYPGFNYAINPGYDPTGAGLPLNSHNLTLDSPPPAYQESITSGPLQMQQNQAASMPLPNMVTSQASANTPTRGSTTPTLGSTTPTQGSTTPTERSNGSGEASPLVVKPPLPNN